MTPPHHHHQRTQQLTARRTCVRLGARARLGVALAAATAATAAPAAADGVVERVVARGGGRRRLPDARADPAAAAHEVVRLALDLARPLGEPPVDARERGAVAPALLVALRVLDVRQPLVAPHPLGARQHADLGAGGRRGGSVQAVIARAEAPPRRRKRRERVAAAVAEALEAPTVERLQRLHLEDLLLHGLHGGPQTPGDCRVAYAEASSGLQRELGAAAAVLLFDLVLVLCLSR